MLSHQPRRVSDSRKGPRRAGGTRGNSPEGHHQRGTEEPQKRPVAWKACDSDSNHLPHRSIVLVLQLCHHFRIRENVNFCCHIQLPFYGTSKGTLQRTSHANLLGVCNYKDGVFHLGKGRSQPTLLPRPGGGCLAERHLTATR